MHLLDHRRWKHVDFTSSAGGRNWMTPGSAIICAGCVLAAAGVRTTEELLIVMLCSASVFAEWGRYDYGQNEYTQRQKVKKMPRFTEQKPSRGCQVCNSVLAKLLECYL